MKEKAEKDTDLEEKEDETGKNTDKTEKEIKIFLCFYQLII